MAVPIEYIFKIAAFVKTQVHLDEINLGLSQNAKWRDGYTEFKKDLRKNLKFQQRKRCAFCRCRVSIGTSFSNLEHLVGKTAYPQFQFHTPNLVYCCTRCNLAKSQIPVLASPIGDKTQQTFPYKTDEFKIINPYYDDYEDHIDFLDDVIIMVANNSTKGEVTIKNYGLTRVDLAEERATEFKLVGDSVEKILLKRLTDPGLPQEMIDQILAVLDEIPNWVIED